MRTITLALASLFLSSSLTGFAAPKKIVPGAAKTPAVEVKYKAACGAIYSSAEAKKYHYVCPMDHKPLKKIAVPVKRTQPAAKPAK